MGKHQLRFTNVCKTEKRNPAGQIEKQLVFYGINIEKEKEKVMIKMIHKHIFSQ